MDLIKQIRTIYDNYGLKTKILAASIRHPLHLVQAATIGADISTVPFSVIKQMMSHPLTDVGLKRFLEDWEKGKAALGGTGGKTGASSASSSSTPADKKSPAMAR